MATLTQNLVNRNGVQDALVAAAGGGDACAADANSWIEVNNGGGSSITVTLAIPASASSFPNQVYTNKTVTVTNGTRQKIKTGPEYKDPTTGLCTITYSAVTSVTVGAFTNTQP